MRVRKVFGLDCKRDTSNRIEDLPWENYQQTIGSMRRTFYDPQLISSGQLKESMTIVDSLIYEIDRRWGLNLYFSKLRSYNYTYVHSVNVALLTTLLGKELGYRGDHLRHLTLGALLHDLGKLAIPKDILLKPSALTSEEFKIVKRHPLLRVDILSEVNVPSDVLAMVSQHHERWNGEGYPNHLMQRGIHLNAQIVAVADVFEALIADRPYRVGIPPYHALEMIISGSGTDFSPEVVQALQGLLMPLVNQSTSGIRE